MLSRRWFGLQSLLMFSACLADKHLIVSVAAVNWAGRRRDQDLKAPPQTGKYRRELARRFNYLPLQELSRCRHAIVSRINRATNQFDLLFRHFGGVVHEQR